MRHFKKPDGKIAAVEVGQESLIQDGWIELSEAELQQELEKFKAPLSAEEIRNEALANLTHEYADGRIIQIRPFPFSPDEANIRNAIERMNRNKQPVQPWKMADDSIALLTVEDLEEAIASGQDKTAQVWKDYFEAINS